MIENKVVRYKIIRQKNTNKSIKIWQKLKKDYDELRKSIDTIKEDCINNREQSFQIQKH